MPLLEPGQPAPALRLPDQTGTMHDLADFRGKRVVLYFYPQDDTPKCTEEACSFRDAIPQIDALQGVVLGVSPDTTSSHAAFASKHRLPFPLLADVPDAKGIPQACNAFGTWVEKNMYGKKFWGVARVTYLINEQGIIAKRWGKVQVDGHASEVLEALRGSQTPTIEAKPTKPSSASKASTKAKPAAKSPAKPDLKPAAKRSTKPTTKPARAQQTSSKKVATRQPSKRGR